MLQKFRSTSKPWLTGQDAQDREQALWDQAKLTALVAIAEAGGLFAVYQTNRTWSVWGLIILLATIGLCVQSFRSARRLREMRSRRSRVTRGRPPSVRTSGAPVAAPDHSRR